MGTRVRASDSVCLWMCLCIWGVDAHGCVCVHVCWVCVCVCEGKCVPALSVRCVWTWALSLAQALHPVGEGCWPSGGSTPGAHLLSSLPPPLFPPSSLPPTSLGVWTLVVALICRPHLLY